MRITTTHTSLPASSSMLEGPKRWLQRQLRKKSSRQTLKAAEKTVAGQEPVFTERPHTAPSTQTDTGAGTSLPVPAIPISIEPDYRSLSSQPPLRPPRPDASVIRDVNAWLDASMITPSPPLMGGLSYWRTATTPGIKDTADMQHAIPIIRDPGQSKLFPSHGQRGKSIRRCAKKVHVQMPSLLRAKSYRAATRKQNRRSVSMPFISLPYENTTQAAPPVLLGRSGTVLRAPARPSTANAAFGGCQEPNENKHHRLRSPASLLGEQERHTDRLNHARFLWMSRSAESTRPSTAAAGRSREDSMGNLSDAPTYFSGPPPPSYRSRAASIMTTSSFGCIDGMGRAQRQISQQRTAQRRGVRGKLERLAHNFTTQ